MAVALLIALVIEFVPALGIVRMLSPLIVLAVAIALFSR